VLSAIAYFSLLRLHESMKANGCPQKRNGCGNPDDY